MNTNRPIDTVSDRQTSGQIVLSLAEKVLQKSSELRSLASMKLEDICAQNPEIKGAHPQTECELPKYFQTLKNILLETEHILDSIAATINRVDV